MLQVRAQARWFTRLDARFWSPEGTAIPQKQDAQHHRVQNHFLSHTKVLRPSRGLLGLGMSLEDRSMP